MTFLHSFSPVWTRFLEKQNHPENAHVSTSGRKSGPCLIWTFVYVVNSTMVDYIWTCSMHTYRGVVRYKWVWPDRNPDLSCTTLGSRFNWEQGTLTFSRPSALHIPITVSSVGNDNWLLEWRIKWAIFGCAILIGIAHLWYVFLKRGWNNADSNHFVEEL